MGKGHLFLIAEFQFINVEGMTKIDNHLCQTATMDAKVRQMYDE